MNGGDGRWVSAGRAPRRIGGLGHWVQTHTGQITRIQESCRHVLEIMVLNLAVQDFKHTGRRVDGENGNVWEAFLDLGGHGADAAGIIKDCGRGTWGYCFGRLRIMGDQRMYYRKRGE